MSICSKGQTQHTAQSIFALYLDAMHRTTGTQQQHAHTGLHTSTVMCACLKSCTYVRMKIYKMCAHEEAICTPLLLLPLLSEALAAELRWSLLSKPHVWAGRQHSHLTRSGRSHALPSAPGRRPTGTAGDKGPAVCVGGLTCCKGLACRSTAAATSPRGSVALPHLHL